MGRADDLARLGRHLRVVAAGEGERDAFTQADLDQLLSDRALVPGGGAAAPVAVARTTCTATGVAFYDPARLLAAW
ncbi:MAG TPA: hypothetical protein VKP11_09155 [Frankiaceae bacterium]|nr:hypothetical protein [Frankiaceae bacterium]